MPHSLGVDKILLAESADLSESDSYMMQIIPLHDFKPAVPGEHRWMAVQRAWADHPEQRPQLADNLRRIVGVVNGVVTVSDVRHPHAIPRR
jgi:hypothetical protein